MSFFPQEPQQHVSGPFTKKMRGGGAGGFQAYQLVGGAVQIIGQ